MVVSIVNFQDRTVILADGQQLLIVEFLDDQGFPLPDGLSDPEPEQIQEAVSKAAAFICGSPGNWYLVPMEGLEPVKFH